MDKITVGGQRAQIMRVHQLCAIDPVQTLFNLRVQKSVLIDVEDKRILGYDVTGTGASIFFKSDPCAAVLDSPVAASRREGVVEAISPLDASEQGDHAHESQGSDEYNAADVDDPEDLVPAVAFFLFFLHLLGAEDVYSVWHEWALLRGRRSITVQTGRTTSVACLLILDVEVQV